VRASACLPLRARGLLAGCHKAPRAEGSRPAGGGPLAAAGFPPALAPRARAGSAFEQAAHSEHAPAAQRATASSAHILRIWASADRQRAAERAMAAAGALEGGGALSAGRTLDGVRRPAWTEGAAPRSGAAAAAADARRPRARHLRLSRGAAAAAAAAAARGRAHVASC